MDFLWAKRRAEGAGYWVFGEGGEDKTKYDFFYREHRLFLSTVTSLIHLQKEAKRKGGGGE